MAENKMTTLEDKNKNLHQENLSLKRELESYKAKEAFINHSVIQAKEAFDVANFNAQKIVIKGLDFANLINKRIEVLLTDLDATNSSEEAKKIIDEFVTKNHRYFIEDDYGKVAVAKKIKDRIIARTRN